MPLELLIFQKTQLIWLAPLAWQGPFCILSLRAPKGLNPALHPIRFIFFFSFHHDFVRAISLEPLLAETPNWVCCLVLQSNFALLLTIQFASFFFFFFRHDFVLAISLELLLAKTPNWVCCLVLRPNFALLLTIQFASLISSLINIISLLLTTFDWTKVEMQRVVCVEFFISGGSLLGSIQGDREPVLFEPVVPASTLDCSGSVYTCYSLMISRLSIIGFTRVGIWDTTSLFF